MKRELTCVCGTISPKELGFCQSHEHLAISKGRSWEIDSNLCIDNVEKVFWRPGFTVRPVALQSWTHSQAAATA
ncbi:hypothetical protein AALA78_02535 [Lachnospiraceae bacterium 42-17]|nr:hypothetical protein [Dorea sp.]